MKQPADLKTSGRARQAGLSRKAIRAALVAAEGEYRICWATLIAMKRGAFEPDTGLAILRFQETLVDALDRLEKLYGRIKREEKRLIASKAKYRRGWFVGRMSALRAYGKFIREGLAVGRALGDAFAWFFYERDLELIHEHLQEQRQPFMPSGAGGVAERATLKQLQGVGRKLLIYHGTTTFLRLGDVSLIDLDSLRVCAVGEIKSEPISDKEISVRVELSAKSPDVFSGMKMTSKPIVELQLPAGMQERAVRQRRRLAQAITKADAAQSDSNVGSQGEFHYDELTEVVRRAHRLGFEFAKAGPSMVLGAYRSRRPSSLAASIMGSAGDVTPLLKGVERWALQILERDIEGNSLYVGNLGGGSDNLGVTPEAIPFLLWPAPDDVLEDLLFGDVMVVTLFNPAHFWRALQDRGFELEWGKDYRTAKATRRTGKLVEELVHFEYFHRLISNQLVSLPSVMGMIEVTLGHAREKRGKGPMRVNIRPQVTRGPRRQTAHIEASPLD